MNTPLAHCVLCGSSSATSLLLGGANGFACYRCLGKLFAAVAESYGQERSPGERSPPATKRCVICDGAITDRRLVVYRHPYCFCGACLQDAFDSALSGSEPLAVVLA